MNASTDANMLISVNPSGGGEVGRVEVTPTSAIPRIVSSAWSTGHAWRMLSLEERAVSLMMAGEQLAARADEPGELLSGHTSSNRYARPIGDA